MTPPSRSCLTSSAGLRRSSRRRTRRRRRHLDLGDGGRVVGPLGVDGVAPTTSAEALPHGSARPLPYSVWSSMTTTFWAFSVSLMYLATSGPCCVVGQHPVEDLPAVLRQLEGGGRGVMIGRPASLNFGLAALDSPEKPGRRCRRRRLSLMASRRGRAPGGDRPASRSLFSATLQSAFSSFHSSSANSAPCLMLMPRLAFGPVSARRSRRDGSRRSRLAAGRGGAAPAPRLSPRRSRCGGGTGGRGGRRCCCRRRRRRTPRPARPARPRWRRHARGSSAYEWYSPFSRAGSGPGLERLD